MSDAVYMELQLTLQFHHTTCFCVAGVHDISGPGAACRAADSHDRRLRTYCTKAGAWISPAERRQQRLQTSVLQIVALQSWAIN